MVLFKKGLKVRGGWKIVKGLPADAQLLTIAAEPLRGGVMMVIESEEYPLLDPTKQPPIEVVAIELNDRHIKVPGKKT